MIEYEPEVVCLTLTRVYLFNPNVEQINRVVLQNLPNPFPSRLDITRLHDGGPLWVQTVKKSYPMGQCQQVCTLNTGTQHLLDAAMDKLNLSARAYYRILRIARTITDLATEHELTAAHVGEAIGYRVLDRIPNS